MTEAIEQPQEYVVELEPIVAEVPEEVEALENRLLPKGTKNLVVESLEYGIGAMAGFTVSDLISAKIEVDNMAYFTANPSVWWAIPGVKVVAAIGLLYMTKKISNPDMKRFMLGFDIGIWADVANDLITAFRVDESLGIAGRYKVAPV